MLSMPLLACSAEQREQCSLASREEMFSAAVDSMLDCFAVLRAVRDDDGTIVDFAYDYVNDAACREIGLTREQTVGRRLRDVLPGHGSAGMLSDCAQVVESGEALSVDAAPNEAMPQDGQRVVEYRVVKLGDGVTITWRDVTERHRKDRQLARWGEVFENAGWGVAVSSGNGRAIEFMNPEFARMHGYTPDELTGRPVREFFTEAAWAEVPAHIAHAEAAGRHSFESEHVRADGSTFPVRVNITMANDEAGKPTYRIVHLEDLSERKAAERAARDAETRFRAVFDRAPAGMALVSVAEGSYGEMLQVNEALCEILGAPRASLVGSRVSAQTATEDREKEHEHLAAVVAEQASGRLDVRIVRPGGEIREVAIRFSAPDERAGTPYVIKHVIDVSERRRFEERLEYLADHDALTGLFNRRRFGEELTRHVGFARRHAPSGAVLLVDLDNFKYVNDTLGHQVGDQMIRDAARLLQANLRASDTLARLGGDEFVVLLPDADRDTAMTVARHLGAVFEVSTLGANVGPGTQLTLSIGVKTIDDRACSLTWEELLAEADIALYAAKEAGRNRAVPYGDDSHGLTRMHEHLSWSQRLRKALSEDALELHAQPVVPLQDREDAPRYELLVRLPAPDGTVYEPSEFLPVAHSFGMMRQLDRQVITKAMRIAASCDARTELAINISAESLGDEQLPDFIADHAAEHGIDPARLMFEVTETVAIANLPRAAELTERLHELGCLLALDDFGAGFGSFYYLKRLPFDYLKIDGGFVRELCHDRTDQVMVQAMVQTARRLGKKTIAEWVGDAGTMSRLAAYDVDYAQGYHIAAPGPAEEVLSRHATRRRDG